MLQGSMNLTVAGINQTIEDVLEEYPAHPYHSAFSIPELRQKLITHILGQMPYDPATEGLQDDSKSAHVRQYVRLQVRLKTEMLVRGSILHILRENAVWLSRHLPEF